MVKLPIWPKFMGTYDIDLRLSRVKKLLNLAGNPESKIKNIIHVAGTNGKGSTSAFLRSFLRSAGYSVNFYSSPHLVNFNERISLNGEDIDDFELNQLSKKYQKITTQNNLPITFFEGSTVMAFDSFANNIADFNIIEVGLGGRLDATNILTDKLAIIITPISCDHQEFLGNDLIDIAKEKAGIIINNSHVFIGKQEEEVQKMLAEIACAKNCKVNFFDEYNEILPKNLGLYGEHQILNFKLAATVFKHITGKSIAQNYYKFLNWPARLQNISDLLSKKYDNLSHKIYLDGGHNEDAAKVIKNFIEQNNITHVILAMVKRKDISKFTAIIKATQVKIYLTQITSNEESITMGDLPKEVQYDEYFANYELALQKILKEKQHQNIILTGSLFFAAEILTDLAT